MNYLAVDLGGTRIKLGIISNGFLIKTRIIKAYSDKGLKPRLNDIKKEIQSLMHTTGIHDITSLGIAFPGLVNTDQNCVLGTSGKYDDAHLLDLVDWGASELGLDVRLENDARMACLGEWKHGAGKGYSDMVMCTLGTGIGSAAIINNQILRGKHYQAGVLGGHFILDYKNNTRNQCSCGNTGCLESVASSRMIAEKAKANALYHSSMLQKQPMIDLENIITCATLGDKLAIELKEHCLFAWAIGLINLIHAYDPEIVIIGGGIAHAQHSLIPYFKKIIADKAWTPWGIPEIKAARYPDTAALFGVTSLFESVHEKRISKV